MRIINRVSLLLLILGISLGQVKPAAGQSQSGGRLFIDAPITSDFPDVRLRMEAYDDLGNFVFNLKPAQIKVLEEDIAIQPDEIEMVANGLQITVALNASPALSSPVNGSTQYAEIQSALAEWSAAQPAVTLDDFSLATPTGLFLIRSHQPQQWEKAIREYQPDLARLTPSLNSLADALDLATDPLDHPEMKRAILFITPPLPPSVLATIPDYTSRARQIGVKVFVWVVMPGDTPNNETSGPLQELAAQTSGRYQVLTPSGIRPDIEDQLKHLRQGYMLQYSSQLKTSGTHQLAVQLNTGQLELISNTRNLAITILPPNPIFLSPPPLLELLLASPPEEGQATPISQEVPLNILIEFPDQHERLIKSTRLYVNGELVAENLQPPFDQFIWKLDEISESGPQMLRVEVMDTLDLSGASLEIPIDVVVVQPQKELAVPANSGKIVTAAGAVVLSGAVLALVLVVSRSKKRPAARRRRGKGQRDPIITQPITTPVQLAVAQRESDSLPRSAAAGSAPARLISLIDNEQPIPGGAIPVFSEEITFGSDPLHAIQVLESTSVDGLHARIFMGNDGDYFLADQNSVAGTWINYAPVTAQGARLEHGDLVHIGRVMFRFEFTDPERVRRREISVYPLQDRYN